MEITRVFIGWSEKITMRLLIPRFMTDKMVKIVKGTYQNEVVLPADSSRNYFDLNFTLPE